MRGSLFQRRSSPVLIVGARRSAQDLARGRMVFVSALFVLACVVVSLRLLDLTILRGAPQAREPGEILARSAAPEDAGVVRADITDRNGVLLATSLETVSLYADPEKIVDAQGTAQSLARLFKGESAEVILEKLSEKKRFVWIRRDLTPAEQAAVLDIGDPGLDFRVGHKRFYPQGALAAHIVGYTDTDGGGLAGLERGFDARLGKGDPVVSSLDIRIQHALRREISGAIKDFTAKAGAGAVLDVKTGEVLAAVSLPDFDPNEAGKADAEARFNRVTLGVYELGSMFKIFSTAALLDVRKVDFGHSFDASKPLRRGGFKISDFHPENRLLTVPEVFMYSSNIGSALMGETVGTRELRKFYANLGLAAPMKIEGIAETGMPLLPEPWREINTLTASYGHGIAVSPMQLAGAVATIAGDGRAVHPTFIVRDADAQGSDSRAVVSPVTARKMRQLLRLAVSDGTGKKAEVPGYRIGGKTGTSEKIVAGRYDTDLLMSSFVGVFPAEDPRYLVLVVVDEPKPNAKSYGYATGGWVAAPAAGRVIAAMGAVMGLDTPLEKTPDIAAPLRRHLHGKEKKDGGGKPAISAPMDDISHGPLPLPPETSLREEARLAAN